MVNKECGYLPSYRRCTVPLPSSNIGGFPGSSTHISGGTCPHKIIEIRPFPSCSLSGNAFMPCFHKMLVSRPNENSIPFTCGKYAFAPLCACSSANSRVAPNVTPIVMFCCFARCGLLRINNGGFYSYAGHNPSGQQTPQNHDETASSLSSPGTS